MSKKKIVDADALLAYITDWKGNLEKHSTYDGHERVESAIETLNCLMGHIEDEAAYMDEILPQWTNADKEPPKKGFTMLQSSQTIVIMPAKSMPR